MLNKYQSTKWDRTQNVFTLDKYQWDWTLVLRTCQWSWWTSNEADLWIKQKTQITYVRTERCGIPTDSTDGKWIIKKYCDLLCAYKFDNLDEIDKFFERHKLPKLTQEETDSLNCLAFI
jgi:hypothetical protein